MYLKLISVRPSVPPSMFDAEDPASVDVIPGEWRKGPSGESWMIFHLVAATILTMKQNR
jgi:hypothetical protein